MGLTTEQQDILDKIKAEFNAINKSAKTQANDFLKEIEDRINATTGIVEEVKKHNNIECKKAEAFLKSLIKELKPITTKYELSVDESGFDDSLGIDRGVYLKLERFSKDYNTKTEILNIDAKYLYEDIRLDGVFKRKITFRYVTVSYPTYHISTDSKLDIDVCIKAVVDWLVYYKSQEQAEKDAVKFA